MLSAVRKPVAVPVRTGSGAAKALLSGVGVTTAGRFAIVNATGPAEPPEKFPSGATVAVTV